MQAKNVNDTTTQQAKEIWAQCKELNGRVSAYEIQVFELKSTLASRDTEIETLNAQNQINNDKIASLSSTIDYLTSTIKEYELKKENDSAELLKVRNQLKLELSHAVDIREERDALILEAKNLESVIEYLKI